MFERELKERNPDKRELSYDIKELHAFIDRLVCLLLLKFHRVMLALTSPCVQYPDMPCPQRVYLETNHIVCTVQVDLSALVYDGRVATVHHC
jgi:hypothetical protein